MLPRDATPTLVAAVQTNLPCPAYPVACPGSLYSAGAARRDPLTAHVAFDLWLTHEKLLLEHE